MSEQTIDPGTTTHRRAFRLLRLFVALTAVAALFAPSPTSAAELHDGVDVGVQGFVGFARLNLKETQGLAERMLPGLGLGLVVRAGIAERMSLEAGLGYRVRGNRFSDDEYDFPNNVIYRLGFKMRIDYVSVPVLFNYHVLQDAGDLRFFAGFEAGIAVRSSGQIQTVDQFNRPDPIPFELDPEPFDFGPLVGIGFDVPMDRRAFGIDGRFYLGLFDTIPEIAPSKTRQLTITVTYWLNEQ